MNEPSRAAKQEENEARVQRLKARLEGEDPDRHLPTPPVETESLVAKIKKAFNKFFSGSEASGSVQRASCFARGDRVN